MEPGGYLERIRGVYFSNPANRMPVRKGDVLLRQERPNDRLYFVIRGTFSGSAQVEGPHGEKQDLELFLVTEGGFIGVHSFFSASGLASMNVTALTDGELAFIDRHCAPVDEALYGGLIRQFFGIIMHEMDRRQIKLVRAAREREAYQKRMHIAEDMAALGQFAAGLAHELNNSIGVLRSSSAHVARLVAETLAAYDPALAPWFEKGVLSSPSLSSAETRVRAKELMQRHGMEYEQAKDIVRMMGDAYAEPLPENIAAVLAAWEIGRNCRNMRFASGHAADIIQSIKQLSGGSHTPRTVTDVGASLAEALVLLKNATPGRHGPAGLPGLEIRLDIPANLPSIDGNKSELVQIWANIIKNGIDAMRDAGTEQPRLSVAARAGDGAVLISLANNGPPISKDLQKTLFQPNITTKRGTGHSMGLGLGLYIVKQLVDSYNGEIELCSDAAETCFTVRLPIRGQNEDALRGWCPWSPGRADV